MATRPEYIPVFTETATAIRERMLSNIPDTWRKEDGDYPYDNILPSVSEVMALEMNQDRTLQNCFPQYADDEHMDDLMEIRGLTRKAATASQRAIQVEAAVGVRIPKGYTLTSVILDEAENPIEFTVNSELIITDENPATLYVTCKLTGTVGNLAKGSEFILQPPIPGVSVLTDMGNTVDGTDKESLDDAWTRYQNKVANSDTGGNVNDYARWVTNDFYEDTGISIGKVIVRPCWDKSNGIDGRGTVLVVCASGDYKPVSDEVIQTLQTWLDPEPRGYGYGKAPCGAIVTVLSGTSKAINIEAPIKTAVDADMVYIESRFRKLATDYIHEKVFEEDQDTRELYPIDVDKLSAILLTIPGVEGYQKGKQMLLNGKAENVELIYYDIPELGTVTLT